MRRSFDVKMFLSLITGVIIGLIISSSLNLAQNSSAASKEERAKLEKELAEIADSARAFTEAFPKLAKLIEPSVVSIYTEKKITRPRLKYWEWRWPEDLREWFDKYLDERLEIPDWLKPRGQGSGIIIDEKGHILTNAHVVEGMEEIKVKLYNGESYKAKVVGIDRKTDLAVIKINAEGLIPAKFGDSDKLRTGEWVMSVGNPFGLENSVSVGIVSAKGRKHVNVIPNKFAHEDFIQTDAGVNPGNSGGPLVNLRGEVVGICTAIATRTRGDNRVGFAIPSNIAKPVMESLIKKGKVVRGYLGVGMINLTDDEMAKRHGFRSAKDMRKELNLKDDRGVYVVQVMKGGPALKAGIEAGDVIIAYDGERVIDADDLSNKVRQTPPGKKVKVTVVRDGKEKEIEVKIGEQPEGTEIEVAEAEEEEIGVESKMGITVQTLTPSLAKEYGYEGQKGVIVTQVKRGSVAYLAGIRPGDLIQKVNGKRVTTVEEFEEATKGFSKGKTISLIVWNEEGLRIVRLKELRK